MLNIFKTKNAQTATEYIVIIAVVIIIALIVVSALGGIPTIGGGASFSSNKAILSLKPVGIVSYEVNNESSLLVLKNNNPFAVRINNILLERKALDTFFKTGTIKIDTTSSNSIDLIIHNIKQYDKFYNLIKTKVGKD